MTESQITEPRIRFVLFSPTHPGNIGSVARAIKTMGFSDLRLVNPPPEWLCGESRAMASGAQDVLHGAKVVDTLAGALDGCGLVIAASARHRRLGCPEYDPRECAAQLLAAERSRPAAIVFGPERSGLTNDELDLCNAIVYIPANPAYTSLNLAQAVQIVAYELRMADPVPRDVPPPESPLAGPAELELFYAHLERVLLRAGFLDPTNPRHLMRRLRRLFNRTQLDQNELNILRGILSAVMPGSGSARGATGRQEEAADKPAGGAAGRRSALP